MDGGTRQEEMAERLKREVRERSHRRREERSGSTTFELIVPGTHIDAMEACPAAFPPPLQHGSDCTLTPKDGRTSIPFKRSDTILVVLYLEHLFPFLFPFYHPSLLQGGRAWILEMMFSSPVVRNATLCQSSYFLSLAQGAGDVVWKAVLMQTRDAFVVLRQALQVISGPGISEHLHGAVRIMASIMQVQRFEITILSFENCHAHLNAALAIFTQLLESTGAVEWEGPSESFNTVMERLGPSSWILPAQCVQVLSAEQAAFRFSSALLVLDDIIASTILQTKPGLYEYHRSLIGNIDGTPPPINLEAAMGCQNWVLLQVGEIAVLDEWKQRCKRAGNLDVMELVGRATAIKDFLVARLMRLKIEPAPIPKEGSSLLDALGADSSQSQRSFNQTSLVTSVWAHAALIYLFVVVSGWQPASVDLRYHVDLIIELLTHQISPPALLRTMVWPFCVAGCLAERTQEAHFRGMVQALQPPSVFGTVRKALEIMENVWRNRDAGDAASRDLAMCFRSQGDLVLLV